MSLPELQRDLATSYEGIVLAAFTVPGVAATLLEPPLLLLADRRPAWRRALVVGGLCLMGLGLLGASLATTPLALALALSVVWVSSGPGVNLALATLMDADPERRERSMGRWVLLGTLGDLAAPLLVALLASVALGWRSAMAIVGVLLLVHAGVLATRRFPQVHDDEITEAPAPAEASWRLWAWLSALSLCGLLDEMFVALASAWLAEAHGASLTTRGVLLSATTLGGVLGLLAQERALARGVSPRGFLLGACVATLAALLAFVAAPDLATAAVALLVLEATAVHLYPLATAQAHRSRPGSSAFVEAAAGLFAPVEWLAPLAIAWVADRYGLGAALLCLAVQPLGVGLVAWLATQDPPR